MPFEVVADYI